MQEGKVTMHPSIKANLGQPVPDDMQEEVRGLISRVRTKMTVLVPFFGHLLLKLDPIVTREVPLAAVSRDRKLLINPDWAQTTTRAEFAATMVHEVLHPAFLVWDRQGSRNAIAVGRDGSRMSLWNSAHDYAIDLVIRDMTKHTQELLDPAKWEPPGLIDEDFRDHSAEEIYDILLSRAKSPPMHGSAPDGAGGSGQGGAGVYIEGVDATKSDLLPGDESGDKNEGEAKLSPSEQKISDQFWKVSLVEAAQVHEQRSKQGALPSFVRKLISQILDSRIPWADALSRWVGENGRRADFTYRRPSRRSSAIGEMLPSMQRHGVDDIVVLWDTSGSMDGREVEILGEVMGICQDLNMSLRVICCDAAIHSDQTDVDNPEDIDVLGGGGSDFCPAFDLLEEEGYQGVVVAFTDGAIGVPHQKPQHLRDCLWVLWGRETPPTNKWGETLYIDAEGYV
jgi:predicted metal-dependent peptidase